LTQHCKLCTALTETTLQSVHCTNWNNTANCALY